MSLQSDEELTLTLTKAVAQALHDQGYEEGYQAAQQAETRRHYRKLITLGLFGTVFHTIIFASALAVMLRL